MSGGEIPSPLVPSEVEGPAERSRGLDAGFSALLEGVSRLRSIQEKKENGFTLIEMMVALAIFSLAALALLRLEGATLSQTAILRDRTIGQIVARNVAVEALTDRDAPPIGVLTGEEMNAGRRWTWVRTATATPDTRVERIDVAVRDAAGQQAGALTVFRLSLT